jgi:hypothetical protein
MPKQSFRCDLCGKEYSTYDEALECETKCHITLEESKEYLPDTKVYHNKYGFGIIVEDLEGTCRSNEVLVYFEDGLNILKSHCYTSSSYNDRRDFVDTDIFNIDDLELV